MPVPPPGLVTFLVLLMIGLPACARKMNDSAEYRVRSAVLDGYDNVVLPTGKTGPLNVEFALKFTQLKEVKSKEQLVIVDAFYILVWKNNFLTWDKSQYDGRERAQFSPSEVWVPDIALYNNGDPNLQVAGGTSKFMSTVVVESDGRCVWSGPTSFIFTCSMDIGAWPFDEQKCTMKFGSLSYGTNVLGLEAFKTKRTIADDFIQSATWYLETVSISTTDTDFGNCCPYNFTTINYELHLRRLYQYHMFYLVAPCLILTILAVVGFWVPSESGERIGFVTTLLLSMMVFLLVVPDLVPDSSLSIPILGIFMMSTLVVITAILLVTIGILVCYHSDGSPPVWIQKLFCSKAARRPSPRVEIELERKESILVEPAMRAALPVDRPDTRATTSKVFLEDPKKDELELTYRELSFKLDNIFIWVFSLIIIIMYTVILTTGIRAVS